MWDFSFDVYVNPTPVSMKNERMPKLQRICVGIFRTFRAVVAEGPKPTPVWAIIFERMVSWIKTPTSSDPDIPVPPPVKER